MLFSRRPSVLSGSGIVLVIIALFSVLQLRSIIAMHELYYDGGRASSGLHARIPETSEVATPKLAVNVSVIY